jgi:hypothetical protein
VPLGLQWAAACRRAHRSPPTQAPPPILLPSDIVPHTFQHSHPHQLNFWTNITGFYREATVHPASLLSHSASASASSSSSSSSEISTWWSGVSLPNINSSAHFNSTLAEELRGSWDWASIDVWEMNLKERLPEGLNLTAGAARDPRESEYHWVRGSATLRTSKATGSRSIDYNFYGLHHRPNGTYELYGVPDGMHLDIRNIPRMYRGERERKEIREIVLAELEKELKVQKDMLLLSDVRPDGE